LNFPAISGPVFREQVSSHYTTRSGTAHKTDKVEERGVLYPWHPWVGCVVLVHDVIEKADGVVLRCSRDGEATVRWLELPAWMFVHWMGGTHTELRLPRRRRGQRNSTAADIVVAVRQLVLIANDDLIAGLLNRNKLMTGNGNRWTRERVTSLRSRHKIPVHRPADDGIESWLNLTKAAAHLGISAKTLRIAAESTEIEGFHPLPDGPWIFSRAIFDGSAAQTLAARAHRTAKYPAGLRLGQQNLFL